MEKVINITKENVYEEINKLEYGSIFFRYDSDDIATIARRAFEVINLAYGNALREVPGVETRTENGSWVEYPMDGVFRISWAVRGESPNLGNDDYSFEWIAEKAFNNKVFISLKINEKLHKQASRKANRLGIKFGHNPEGSYFDGRTKRKPIFRQIQDAYASGAESIEFDSNEISASSVRCYASQLGSLMDRKFSVSAQSGKIVVRFKEMTAEDRISQEMYKMFDSVSMELGLERALEKFAEMVNDKTWDTVVVSDKTDIDIEEADRSLYEENSPIEYHSIKAEESKVIEDDDSDFYFESEKPASVEQAPEKPKAIFYKIDPDEPDPGAHLIEDEDFDPDEFGGYWKTVDGKKVYIDPAEPKADLKTKDFSRTESGFEDPIREVEGLNQYYMPELEESPAESKETAQNDDFEDSDF